MNPVVKRHLKRVVAVLLLVLPFSAVKAQDIDSLYWNYREAQRQEKFGLATELLGIFQHKNYMDAPVVFTQETDRDYMDMVLNFCVATEWYVNGKCLQSLDLAQSTLPLIPVDSLLWQFEFYSLMGMDYQLIGDYENALSCCEKEMRVHEKLHRDEYLSITLNSLAVLNTRLNCFDMALTCSKNAVEIERKLNRRDRLAVRLGVEADVLTCLQQYDSALVCLDEAVVLETDLGLVRKADIRKVQKAKVLFLQNHYNEAYPILKAAYEDFEQSGDLYYMAVALVGMGDVEEKMNQPDSAMLHYKEAERIFRDNGFRSVLPNLLERVGNLAVKMGDYEGAYRCMKQYQSDKDSIASHEMELKLSEMEMQYDALERDNEIVLEKEKNHRKVVVIILLSVILVVSIAIAIVEFRLANIRKRRNEELAQSGQNKDRLISIVAHDLRTPVLAQKQMLDNICRNFDKMPAADVKENCELIKESAHSLNDQITNLVQWVSLRNGKLKNNPVRFSPCRIVTQCINAQSSFISAKSLKVFNDIAPDAIAFDDLNIVETVIQNLLSNAVKFSFQEGEIHVAIVDGFLTVSDKGIGISEQRIKEIFEPKKEASSGTAGEKGMGFGLFVCNCLLEEIGSSMKVESKEGNGTEIGFKIHLL